MEPQNAGEILRVTTDLGLGKHGIEPGIAAKVGRAIAGNENFRRDPVKGEEGNDGNGHK